MEKALLEYLSKLMFVGINIHYCYYELLQHLQIVVVNAGVYRHGNFELLNNLIFKSVTVY